MRQGDAAAARLAQHPEPIRGGWWRGGPRHRREPPDDLAELMRRKLPLDLVAPSGDTKRPRTRAKGR
jgi:hypothetical protein